MYDRLLAVFSVVCVFLTPLAALAQTPAPLAPSPASPSAVRPVPGQMADFIVAVVNSEPITNNEVRDEVRRVLRQMANQQQAAPAQKELATQVLQQMINQKIQLQRAQELGLNASADAVDGAEERVARLNQVDVPTLRKNLEQEGYTLTQFREQLRQQLVLAQLREQEVNQRVQVSNTEAEQYLNAQERNPDLEGLQINLAQILVAVADTATPEERAALQDKAQKLRERAVAGEDFAALARSQSNAPEGADGGVLGLRGVDRYPELFVTATRQLKVGEVSDVLRSDAGWHILKVLQKITPNVPPVSVTQTRARHILLRPGPDRTESQALAELADFKRRVDTGQADFVTLAREHSQDSSADKGGDLDWLNPGSVVAEFEAVLNRLAPGQLGEPFVSRFGVHLLQVLGRRQQTLSSEQRRNDMRTMLLQKKQQEAYLNWLQDLRHQAYVEMREAPR